MVNGEERKQGTRGRRQGEKDCYKKIRLLSDVIIIADVFEGEDFVDMQNCCPYTLKAAW